MSRGHWTTYIICRVSQGVELAPTSSPVLSGTGTSSSTKSTGIGGGSIAGVVVGVVVFVIAVVSFVYCYINFKSKNSNSNEPRKRPFELDINFRPSEMNIYDQYADDHLKTIEANPLHKGSE